MLILVLFAEQATNRQKPEEAIRHYEISETHRYEVWPCARVLWLTAPVIVCNFQVPRMLFNAEDIEHLAVGVDFALCTSC